jgi:hypothetical protein
MQDDSLKASVTYGDYDGTVAADRRDRNGDLSDLAGVSLSIGEHRDQATEVKKPYVSILAIDTHVVKAYGVDPIQRYVDGNDGVLPYVKLRIDATLEEILLAFKRFELVIKNKHLKRVREFRPDYEGEEVDTDDDNLGD